MEEKKMSGVTPCETVEELNDAELSQVSGGVTSYVGSIARRNTNRYTPNTSNVANSTDVIGQKKYTIDRIAGRVSAPASTQKDEP